jgi:hypothetical protein
LNWRLTGFVRGEILLLTLGASQEDIYKRAAKAVGVSGYSVEEIEPICLWRWGEQNGTDQWVYVGDLDLRRARIYRGQKKRG